MLIVCLMVLADGVFAQKIPLRTPTPGESRPYWWLLCWGDYDIVVLKGTVEILDDNPIISLKLDEKQAKKYFKKKDLEFLKCCSDFFLASIDVDETLFIGAEAAFSDMEFADPMRTPAKLKFLLPSLKDSDGRHIYDCDLACKKKTKGVFIFRISQNIFLTSLILEAEIPQESLQEAIRLFEYRRALQKKISKEKAKSKTRSD